ncbi:MAG: hypothetical protein Q4C05_01280 [Akkermansia sp.]|nr:hypothetical protein [Akkermansia sp.]
MPTKAGNAAPPKPRKKVSKILLFVRQGKNDEFGNTSAFHCFGLVNYISSEGDCPMNIQWKLQEPAMAQYIRSI